MNNKSGFLLDVVMLFTVSGMTSHWHFTVILSTDLSMAKNQSDVENLVMNCRKEFYDDFT